MCFIKTRGQALICRKTRAQHGTYFAKNARPGPYLEKSARETRANRARAVPVPEPKYLYVRGAGFFRCRKNPLVFRLSARRGGHGVQFFFLFFLSLLPSPPGLLFLLGSLPLQDSPLSRIPRSPSTSAREHVSSRDLQKTKNRSATGCFAKIKTKNRHVM